MTKIDWTRLLRTPPFEPFEVRLRDGRSYRVDAAEHVMRTRDFRTILVEVVDSGETARFTTEEVAGVTILSRRKEDQ